jgi:hypothetical protein
MKTQDWVTFAIASYGALLSTVVALQAFLKERRTLKLRLRTTRYTYPFGDVGPPMLSIEVVNSGHRILVADAPQLMVASDPQRVLAMMTADGLADFPKRLEDGEMATVRIGYRDIANTLTRGGHSGTVRLLAICKDSTGRLYKSKPWKIDIAEWLKTGT